MSLADLASRPIDSPITHAIRTVAARLAAFQARRSQDVALQSLLFAPENRLRDLGITRDELFTAMSDRRR